MKFAPLIIPFRGFHLDLKGVPPTPERLSVLLDIVVAAQYNLILVEWEDMFPWTVDPRFRSPEAYTPEQVTEFLCAAKKRGLEVVPLVQCLGHLETFLALPEYAPLREIRDDSYALCPLVPGARELIQSLINDVLALMPECRYFHLGGDEVWSFGLNPLTCASIRAHGRGATYLGFVEPLLDRLAARGIRSILWHDMMAEWESPALQRLAGKADLMVWGYSEHPDRTQHHFRREVIERLYAAGITLWGATAYKGASGADSNLPRYEQRQENALAWVEVGERYGMAGVVATAWSRYNGSHVQCEPIDGALTALVNVGTILHDGHPPADGEAGCLDILQALGEADRYRACAEALRALQDACEAGWQHVRTFWQVMTTLSLEPHRGQSAQKESLIQLVREAVKRCHAAEATTRSCFTGLMTPLALEHFLAERVVPLDEAYVYLNDRLESFVKTHPYALAAAADPWESPYVQSWNLSRLLEKDGDFECVPPVSLAYDLQWQALTAAARGILANFVNVHERYGEADGYVYLANRFTVVHGGVWDFLAGHDGSCRIFVDGQEALTVTGLQCPAMPDRSRVRLALTAGVHEIVIAFDTHDGNAWGGFFRFSIPESERTPERAGCFPMPDEVMHRMDIL